MAIESAAGLRSDVEALPEENIQFRLLEMVFASHRF
jgi:hypothetical protein